MNGSDFDCSFVVGQSPEDKIFKAHRYMLGEISPVFHSMFFGSLPENEKYIYVPDVEPVAFRTIRYFAYIGDVLISSLREAYDLYYAAHKYMIPDIISQCTEFMLWELSPANACRVYEFGKFFDDARLMKGAMKYIFDNTIAVIEDPSFHDIEVHTLLAIFNENIICFSPEWDIYVFLKEVMGEAKKPENIGYKDDLQFLDIEKDTLVNVLIRSVVRVSTKLNVNKILLKFIARHGVAEIIEYRMRMPEIISANYFDLPETSIWKFEKLSRSSVCESLVYDAIRLIKFLAVARNVYLNRNNCLMTLNPSGDTGK